MISRSLLVLPLAGLLLALFAGPVQAQSPAAKPAAKPASAEPKIFKDCEVCPEMVVLPKGAFIMGSDLLPAEQPKHPVFIKKPFAMSRFEITFDNWEACLIEKGCTHNPHDHNWGRGRQPIMNIDFHMAE
ncbi:MAG: SUMF1/EgtB/PvdO family nonheme iron enzyme, partial [Rhodospirillales bacterium]